MPNRSQGQGIKSHSKTVPLSLLGMRVSGDLGPYTLYTDRYLRKQFFYYTPPTKIPTPAQAAQRLRFKEAQAGWNALTSQEKENLEDACRAASLTLTGQNLYISASIKQMTESYEAVGQQTGIPLPPLTQVTQ